jgi:hypothetical protein
MFTHKKKKRGGDDITNDFNSLGENYFTLKEALLELYLSVKIRSDEEIDSYTEE